MSSLALYSYFRSSAAFRVRIGLNFKGLKFEYRPIHLLKDGGEQFQEEFKNLNPMSEVPCLVHNNRPISQSMAILQYLDSLFIPHPIFPADNYSRAKVIQLCENINAGIHPVQNLKVLNQLAERFGADQEQKNNWAAYWIHRGFESHEKTLKSTAGIFSFGDTVTAADFYLVPQVFNARRFRINLDQFPIINRIELACMKLDAFIGAQPDKQPDYQP